MEFSFVLAIYIYMCRTTSYVVACGGSEAVEALCYKPEGRWFETRRGKLIFSI
jgi:hypothetical protein